MASRSPMNSEPKSDGQLVADVLAGGTDQFELLVRRYQPALLRASQSRLGRWDWAEEAVQETFYCAFKSLHSYNSAFSFRTWLWTILLNQCRRLYQRRQQRAMAPLGSEQKELPGNAVSPATRAIERERDAILHQLLEGLPDADADALRLRFFGGLKFNEIADAMQCGLSTAKKRVRRGLEALSVRMRLSGMDGVFLQESPESGS